MRKYRHVSSIKMMLYPLLYDFVLRNCNNLNIVQIFKRSSVELSDVQHVIRLHKNERYNYAKMKCFITAKEIYSYFYADLLYIGQSSTKALQQSRSFTKMASSISEKRFICVSISILFAYL